MSELWNELHIRALTYRGFDDSEFMKNWSSRIPEYTETPAGRKPCGCRNFWARWYRFNRPQFNPPEKYFEWSIRAHNAVNGKLRKRRWTVAEAREMYESLNKNV